MFNPRYRITDKMVKMLSEIAQAKGEIEKSRLLPTREAFLRVAAVVKMAHTSTSIEGNQLHEYQVRQLVEGKPVKADKNQIREAENYLTALKKIDVLARGSGFGLKDILAVHKIVVKGLVEPEKAGSFRAGPVYIVNTRPPNREELAYTPPAADQVRPLLDSLIRWMEKSSDTHPVIRAGLFHYQFETIHPFTDGNGRTGRLLTLLCLYQSSWGFRRILVLEDFYNQDRKRYHQHLQTGKTYASRQKADLTSWLDYFIEGFWEEALRVKEQILSLRVSGTEFGQNRLNTDELKIIDFVVTIGKITSSDAADILQIPKRTAQAKLKRLEDTQVLHRHGAGPSTYYSVSPLTTD